MPQENAAYENIDLKMNNKENQQQPQANLAKEYESVPTYTDFEQNQRSWKRISILDLNALQK